MSRQATHVQVVRQWLTSLGILTAVNATRVEVEMKLAAYVPMLLDRFTDACFTTTSLEYCASRAAKGFPTYSELAAWLSEWWRDRRPVPPALPAPDSSASAQRAREAAALAAEWDDIPGIRRRIADLEDDPRSLRLLCAAVQRHAPQHLGWFPPAVIEAMRQDAPVPPPADDGHRATARYLTPAQLDQLNPLPGRKRDDATTATHDRDAPTYQRPAVDPDTASANDA